MYVYTPREVDMSGQLCIYTMWLYVSRLWTDVLEKRGTKVHHTRSGSLICVIAHAANSSTGETSVKQPTDLRAPRNKYRNHENSLYSF